MILKSKNYLKLFTPSSLIYLLVFPYLVTSKSRSSKYDFGPLISQVTSPVEHGEGPSWDSRTGLLFFVSILEGRVYSYNPTNQKSNYVQFNGNVTPVIPTEKDPHKFVVGLDRDVISFEWDGESKNVEEIMLLSKIGEDSPLGRINDGKADSKGRLWLGTIGFENSTYLALNDGALYKITKSQPVVKPEVVLKSVSVGNGLAWNQANDKFYYIDSPTQKIMEYDYDEESGRIWNGRTVFDVSKVVDEHKGIVPDGMTIDVDDNLWIALYGGGSVIQIDPRQRKLLRRIAIPATYVTSAMWGGPKFDVLFITTSRHRLNKLERIEQPAAGSVFAITNLNTTGLPVYNANVD